MANLDYQTIALVVTLLGMATGGLWKLTRIETELRACINSSRDDVEEKQTEHSREFGETILALRQHITTFQLEVANNYVRRDGFYKVRDELASDIKSLGDELKATLVRVESKIDSKT